MVANSEHERGVARGENEDELCLLLTYRSKCLDLHALSGNGGDDVSHRPAQFTGVVMP